MKPLADVARAVTCYCESVPTPVNSEAAGPTSDPRRAKPAARRKQMIALVLSGTFPGLGQFYNRQPIKGAVSLLAGLVLSWLLSRGVAIELNGTLPQIGAAAVLPFCALLAIWLWSLVDAWRVAGR